MKVSIAQKFNPFALANSLWGRAAAYTGVAIGNDALTGALQSADPRDYHGQVFLANDSILRETNYIEELTSFAISYDGMVGNKLRLLRDFIMPPRPSTSRLIRVITLDENEPWQTVDYTKVKRPILGDFAEVRQRVASKSDLQVPNRGLCVILDRDELKDKPEWQQMHTKWLIDLMMRATVLEGVSLLEAAAVAYNTNWDAGSNPDLELKQDIIGLANQTGFYPTRAVYGDQAALKRQAAYESQLNAGALARAALMTDEQIATAIGVDKVLTNAERYQSTTSTAKQEIVGSNVILFTAMDDASPMDASNLVRHVADAAYGGGDYAVYVTDIGVKKIALTVENYEYPHIQHTTGVQQVGVN